MSDKLIVDRTGIFTDTGISIDESVSLKATVECFGLWSDDKKDWLATYDGELFWTPSKAVAMVKLQIVNEIGWRVRSFDEWAEAMKGRLTVWE